MPVFRASRSGTSRSGQQGEKIQAVVIIPSVPGTQRRIPEFQDTVSGVLSVRSQGSLGVCGDNSHRMQGLLLHRSPVNEENPVLVVFGCFPDRIAAASPRFPFPRGLPQTTGNPAPYVGNRTVGVAVIPVVAVIAAGLGIHGVPSYSAYSAHRPVSG